MPRAGIPSKPHCIDRTHLGAQVNCMSLIIVRGMRDDFSESILGLFLVYFSLSLSLTFSLSSSLLLFWSAYIFCRFPIGSRIADKEIAPPSTKSKFLLSFYKTEQIIPICSYIYYIHRYRNVYTIWISISIAITNDSDDDGDVYLSFSDKVAMWLSIVGGAGRGGCTGYTGVAAWPISVKDTAVFHVNNNPSATCE